MTSRFRQDSEPITSSSTSTEGEAGGERFRKHGISINRKGDSTVDVEDTTPLLPRLQTTAYSGNLTLHRKQQFRRKLEAEYDDDKKKKRGFCQTWCDMWFILSQSKLGCIILNSLLFGGGLLIILLTTLGGIMDCPELNGAVVYLFLVASLSILMSCLCCCYHWVKDNPDLPFGIFCVAYCLLFLYICITIAGTVVVFTRIHPIGPDQPPPDMVNGTVNVLANCKMVELPLGVLIVCYCVAIVLLLMAYSACLLALGARHIDD